VELLFIPAMLTLLLGRLRQGVERASRQARTRLDEVAITSRNKHGARAVEALSNS
jgi:hypothetical protein